ncbi:putative ABC1 protein At2g40090 isoform X1 [Diospyros lotus]|uniref:putative ABC1 protein At2g40090 isoform X1 n=3 Tax=Diospyros lotus TaxID=55363 RepID=UPI00225172F6|nr:putative ABC1 protein At2g40090 isoform X1 [Diospyros lotus]
MTARYLWRATKKLALAATAASAGVGAAAIVTSDDPATALRLCTTVPVRLSRLSLTAAAITFDYEYSLWGLPEDSIERARIKHEVHIRSARKLEELCFKNGGIYIKLGQHIGQLEYLVPQEYVQRMRESLLNRCPVSSFDQVCEVVSKELGGKPDEIFDEFDPVPIASASLAQVHIARTHDGQKVAVKVQHTHMTDTAAADYATVELIVNTLHRFFPTFDYRMRTIILTWLISFFPCKRWLVDEVHESLPKELDFLVEAKNSVECMDNFRKLSPHIADYVYAPVVYWNLSTSKLLTMEFMDGVHINDVKEIQKLGIQPNDVAKLVSQAFAEMMFKHGFVHCDPHAANLLVRPLPSSRKNILGKRKPQLILLDHGLYKELDLSTRTNYAALWKSLIFSDAQGIKENCVKLGAGEDLYALFAGVLTMRPWNRVIDPAVDHLVLQGDDNDRSELQMYASQYFLQITELLRRLPRVILLMMKTNDCLRAVNNSLLKGSSLETFLIIGKVSSKAVMEAKFLQNKSVLSRISLWLDELLLEVRLIGMQMALWLLQVRAAFSVLPKQCIA